MKKFGLLWISTILFFFYIIAFSFVITQELNEYREKKEEIAMALNFEKRLMSAWEWVPGNSIGEEKVALWQKLELEASAEYDDAILYSALLASVMLVYVFLNILVYKEKQQNYQVFGLVTIFCSMSLLFLALQTPFLELMAYNKDLAFEVPIHLNFDEMDYIGSLGMGSFDYDYEQVFDGRTYYLYQNKSVAELIKMLYTGGNFMIAIILVLVSIVFPILKFITSIIVLLSPQKESSVRIYKVIRNLAKWSMVDVFTSAIFIAYFSYSNMNVGVDTGAETLIGLYYFIGFVVLSINSGQYLKKAMYKAQKIGKWALD